MMIDVDVFGGGKGAKSGVFTATTSFQDIPIGFVPDKIVIWYTHANADAMVWLYDVANSKIYRWYKSNSKQDTTSSILNSYMYMDGTTFKYKAYDSDHAKETNYIAIKE